MAVTGSGLFVQNFVDMMNATQLPFDYIGDTIRCPLIVAAATPDFTVNTVWADLSASEIAPNGSYAAGGDALASKTLVPTGGIIAFKATSPAYTTITTTARAAVIIDDTLTSPLDALICLLDFGADISSIVGTFTVALPTGGFVQIPHV